jgi:hypothetical protein
MRQATAKVGLRRDPSSSRERAVKSAETERSEPAHFWLWSCSRMVWVCQRHMATSFRYLSVTSEPASQRSETESDQRIRKACEVWKERSCRNIPLAKKRHVHVNIDAFQRQSTTVLLLTDDADVKCQRTAMPARAWRRWDHGNKRGVTYRVNRVRSPTQCSGPQFETTGFLTARPEDLREGVAERSVIQDAFSPVSDDISPSVPLGRVVAGMSITI